MLKKLKVVLTILAMASMSLSLFPFLNEALASSGRDYDSNAIMYGGALTYAELINKYDHGTGKQFQSSTELQNFYKTLGMGKEFFPKLVEGKVYKDGHVTVGNKTVATNVYSAGRHDMPGSTRDSRFPYPVFWRHPSVSFRSNALDAFVYVNDDNTMAFAIIKSCGNAVKGVGVKQKHKITVEKFEDKNGNKIKDSEEGMLSGWSFKVTGNGIDKTVMTGVNGTVEVKDLPNGTYTITEVLQTGWTNTTGLTKTVTIKDADQTVCFGNKKVPEKKFRIKVIKFEDCNNDKVQNENEKRLANWEFNLKGNGLDRNVKTDSNGEAIFEDLKPGEYTVTEKLQEGWENTTGLEMKITISKDGQEDYCIYFGNKKKEIVIKKYEIEVIKFEDCNNNKKKDENEKFLSDWEFKLEGNGISKTVKTNHEGKAFFSDLKAGTYKVREVLKDGWENTTGLEKTITIPENSKQEKYCVEFGNKKKEVKKFTIKAFKFEDKNEDKKHDNDEKLLSGWQIRLSGNSVDKTLTTNSQGEVEFTGLSSGTYNVSEVMQDGWTNVTPVSKTITISDKDECVYFGNKKVEVPVKKSRIKVIKFEDKNGNGKKDEGEPYLSGWSITLKGEGIDKTQVTDASGVTIFNDLKLGTYSVTEALQEGWINVSPLTVSVKVDKEDCESVVMFANKRKEIPVTPAGEVTPTPVTAESLPVTGPEAAAMGGFGTISLAGALTYLRRGRKALFNSFRKIK